MVQPKQRESWLDRSARQQKEYDEQNPIVGHKWAVEEVTPAYNTGGYYDQDIPEVRIKVADDFKSEKEALAWIDMHEADKGNYLEAVQFRLREFRPKPYRKWQRVWRPKK
jgi:hypothetical protein